MTSKQDRIQSIDAWRGIGMMLVIMSHVFHGLYGGEVTLETAEQEPLVMVYSLFGNIASIFFITSGATSFVSFRGKIIKGATIRSILTGEAKRSLFLIVFGYAFDFLVYDFRFWIVGTLQIIGLMDLVLFVIYSIFYWNFRRTKKYTVIESMIEAMEYEFERFSIILFFSGILVVILSPSARLLFGYPVYNPSIDLFVYCETPVTFLEAVQAWLTTSFFPIFPYAGFFLAGSWLGIKMCRFSKMDDEDRRNFAVLLFFVGLVCIIGSLVYESDAEEVAGELMLLPQDKQPTWVLESLWGLQPMTNSLFFFYLGFSLVMMAVLIYYLDMKHVSNKFFELSFKMSRDSFTIYVLQFIWVIVLRFVRILTGIQLLYSMDDLLAITALIAASIIVFMAFVVYHERHGYKYGIEWILKKIASTSKT